MASHKNVSTVNLETLRTLAIEARPDLPSYLNCGAINRTIRDALREHGVDCELAIGDVGTAYRGHGEEHAWVVVPAGEVQEATGEVIVDGALDQFNAANHDAGRVWEMLGPKEDIPCPAVLEPGDEFYDVFGP